MCHRIIKIHQVLYLSALTCHSGILIVFLCTTSSISFSYSFFESVVSFVELSAFNSLCLFIYFCVLFSFLLLGKPFEIALACYLATHIPDFLSCIKIWMIKKNCKVVMTKAEDNSCKFCFSFVLAIRRAWCILRAVQNYPCMSIYKNLEFIIQYKMWRSKGFTQHVQLIVSDTVFSYLKECFGCIMACCLAMRPEL